MATCHSAKWDTSLQMFQFTYSTSFNICHFITYFFIDFIAHHVKKSSSFYSFSSEALFNILQHSHIFCPPKGSDFRHFWGTQISPSAPRLGRPSWSSPEAPEPRPPVLRLWAPGSTWRWLGKVPSFGFHFTHIYPQIHIFSGKILDIKLSNPIFSGKIRFIKLGVMQFKQCHYPPNHHK